MNYINLNNKKYMYIPDYNFIINSEMKERFFKYSHNMAKARIHDIEITKDKIERELKTLKQITFEMTQDCNLRCKYCTYSGSYFYHRNRTSRKLKYETAKQAIDYILNIIRDRNDKVISISFYGGEPLLNFKIIKKIVLYSEKTFPDWNIYYFMTTNGTLLKDDVADFLSSHNFRIMVSLDGPREIHDAKRVFRDGRGSFNLIMDNLKSIQKNNKYYFDNNISYSIVWSPDLSLEDIYNFFTTNELLNKKIVKVSSVLKLDTDYFDKCSYDLDLARIKNENIQEKIKNKIKKGEELTPIDYFLFTDPLQSQLTYRDFRSLFEACLFNSRLYIDVEGRFHVCHMMNNKFSFGDVWKGLDFDKMKKICTDFIFLNKKYCYSCNVRYLCQRCYVPFAKDGKFEIDNKFCSEMKNSIIKRLERHIKLKEEKVI